MIMNNTKAKLREEVNNMSFKDLNVRLSEVDVELQKGYMEVSRQQNPYAKDCVSGVHNIKNLKYVKALICNRLSKLSKFGG